MPRLLTAAVVASVAAASGAYAQDAPSGLVAMGKALYEQRCGHCHAVEPGRESMAAPLYNVFGRKAGTAEGYAFSPRITMLDVVWSEQVLWNWIQTTTFDTPLIAMRHVGVKDQASADALVAYLAEAHRAAAK